MTLSIIQIERHKGYSKGYADGRQDASYRREGEIEEAAEVAYWDGYKAAARENQIYLFLTFIAILLLTLLF